MKTEIRININDEVRVRLSEYGKEVWRKSTDRYVDIRYGDFFSTPYMNQERIEEAQDSEGYWRFHFWELMKIFGPHTNLGKDSPFIGEIKIITTI